MQMFLAYFQIAVAVSDMHKTKIMLNQGRYIFRKTVMVNRLSSNSWLKAINEVIEGLHGVFKLVNNLLIGAQLQGVGGKSGGADHKVQEGQHDPGQQQRAGGQEVSFSGYVIDGSTQYADPKKVEAMTKFPCSAFQQELREGVKKKPLNL